MKLKLQPILNILNPFWWIRWLYTEACDTVMYLVRRWFPDPPAPLSFEERVIEKTLHYKDELLRATEERIRWEHTEEMAREMVRELGAFQQDRSFRDTIPAYHHPFPPIDREMMEVIPAMHLAHLELLGGLLLGKTDIDFSDDSFEVPPSDKLH